MLDVDARGIGLSFQIGLVPLIIIIILLLALWSYARRNFWRVSDVEINLFNQKIKIKPNYEVSRIAHKAWTELRSRKAAIDYDPKHDVITEIYDSWYALFGEVRTLIKDIPAEEIRNDENVRKLVYLMMETLNVGIRPHLTEYQARFRRWMDIELKRIDGEKSQYMPIQEIQQNYPDYQELTSHLKEVNRTLMEYSVALQEIAHGRNGSIGVINIQEPSEPTN